jgi:hypothetical protein
VAGGRRSPPRTVAARVLAILGSFSPGHPELSLVEISRRSGLAASTTHRLVGELRAWGALERNADLRYCIGPRLRELAALPSMAVGCPTMPPSGSGCRQNPEERAG